MTEFEGVITNLERRYADTESEFMREKLEELMELRPCPTCGGTRYKPEILAVPGSGLNISQASGMSVLEADAYFQQLQDSTLDHAIIEPFLAGHLGGEAKAHAPRKYEYALNDFGTAVSAPILKAIRTRLKFLVDVGLEIFSRWPRSRMPPANAAAPGMVGLHIGRKVRNP